MPVPSTEEYYRASEVIYHPDHPEMAAAAGLRPFTDRKGTPMTIRDGATVGGAFLDKDNNLIIAFQGTNQGGPVLTGLKQDGADGSIMLGKQPPEFEKADRFARQVRSEARVEGLDPSRVFVTGHSLGGAEAEYVAWKRNLGGESFAAPGVPGYAGGRQPPATGTTAFTNHVAYGDPVANYASDTLAGPIAGDQAHHYGSVHMVGQQANEAGLARDVARGQQDARIMTDPSAAMIPGAMEGAAQDLSFTMIHAAAANMSHHYLGSSYGPALGITPLPEPAAPKQHAQISPQDYWRGQVALNGNGGPSSGQGGIGQGGIGQGGIGQDAGGSGRNFYGAQSAAGLELARQRQLAAGGDPDQVQAQAGQRPHGPRLG